MKNMYLIIILAITLTFLLLPLLAVEKDEKISVSNPEGTGHTNSENTNNESFQRLNEIKLYLCDEKKTVALETNEYLIGVVAAEMSAENNIEALKAQALAAYTYAYRKHIQNQKTNSEYDLTDDSKLDQNYLNYEQRKEKWGSNCEKYENTISQAVKSVANNLIVYNNEPILAAYHKVSAGKTETAKNVWGSDYPYLQAENSVGDLLCPEFYSEVVVSAEDFTKKLVDFGASPGENINEYIGSKSKSDSGTVLSLELCEKKFTGAEVREMFGLKSAAFDITLKENVFIFSVSGNGHGVGMSQYGANYMAQQGSSYKEIITSYYRGSEIIEIK